MISVIICSAREQDLNQVKENISQTVGVPYEIIAYNNSDGQRGICEVYNAGARQARYDTLCFMHEDIEMKTPDWGSKVVNLLSEHPKIGLIGVAGGGYKSVTPSGWYNYGLEINGGAYSNVLQGYKRDEKKEGHDYNNPKRELFSKVACVDGCWLSTRKSVWQESPFDEKLLTKFHGYDLDFSLAIGEKYDVVVTFEVLLRHFSEGNYDLNWFEEMLKVHAKWSYLLPVNADNMIEGDLLQNEKWAFRRFLQDSLDNGITKSALINVVWHSRKSSFIGFNLMVKLGFALMKMKPKKRNPVYQPIHTSL
ncbi:glycosyltransferase [Dyadobacter sp. NIV53]|uniref:glycosyltransferase n=1 Tax=Dyadobacter sp. NIV53 TaxID=2861765 RepID=UPI001C86BAC6|nr:glycosyltransferase [Dyadobacter sp. NIV53]